MGIDGRDGNRVQRGSILYPDHTTTPGSRKNRSRSEERSSRKNRQKEVAVSFDYGGGRSRATDINAHAVVPMGEDSPRQAFPIVPLEEKVIALPKPTVVPMEETP